MTPDAFPGSQVNGSDDKLKVLLADDHHLFREGLRQLLEATGEITVVGEASNGEEAIRFARQFEPRVVLMDINMPVVDGIRATEAVTRSCPNTSVIVLTMFWEDDYAIQAVRAGAKGYLLKNARSEEVIRAVRLAAAGGSAIDPSLAPVLLREYHRMLTRSPEDNHRDGALNQRDLTLLRLLAAGYNNRQIANELSLAESTVKNSLSGFSRRSASGTAPRPCSMPSPRASYPGQCRTRRKQSFNSELVRESGIRLPISYPNLQER